MSVRTEGPATWVADPPSAAQRLWGGALVVLTTLLISLAEVFLVPFAVGGHYAPVALVLLVVAGPLLAWAGRWAMGHPLGAVLPLPFWFIVALLGSHKTATGDLLLTADNWVASAFFLGGLVVWLISVVLVVRQDLAPAAGPSRRPGCTDG